MIVSAQHGDETPAKDSLEPLLAALPDKWARQWPRLQVSVIPEANPDGCAARSRCNADGIDLNRDHQLLRAGETALLHQFVRGWQPHIVLDLHSYPSRRRHLLKRGVVLDHDVFIDVPNHPAILARAGWPDSRDVLGQLLRAVAAQRVRVARYTIVSGSGRARHSTPDVVDARNGLALRYGAFTLLVENRQPRRDETSAKRARLRAAQSRALLALIEWLDRRHELLLPMQRLAPPRPGTIVPVGFKYAYDEKGLRMVCRDARHDRPVSITFSRYSPSLETLRVAALPPGYAVPCECSALLGVLRRHGFISTRGAAGERCAVERLQIERARPARRPNRPARGLVSSPHPQSMDLAGYEVFSTQQSGGDALAAFLEPESKYGLHRFAELHLPVFTHSWYPVLRVFSRQDSQLKSGSHSFRSNRLSEWRN